jgi:phosphoadenosine phosphosulfate reductase
MRLMDEEIAQRSAELEGKHPREAVAWAVDTFGDGLALACSFSAEDVVLVDLLVKRSPRPRVFCLDTGRLHQATYDTMDAVRLKYGIAIESYFPRTEAVEAMVRAKGPNLFYDSVENRKECCRVRKVEPLGRALAGLSAWMTGLRREQGTTRTDVPVVERDEVHGGIVKVNPLAAWTWDEVWAYVRANRLPYNRLHDAGFPSIGCEPCTRAVNPGEDPRAGRWWWELPESKECGLHVR